MGWACSPGATAKGIAPDVSDGCDPPVEDRDSGKGDAGGFMGGWYHFAWNGVKAETEVGGVSASVTPLREEALSIRLRTGVQVGVLAGGRESPAPPLVLLPGVGGAKELFYSLMEPLGRGRRVWAVDLSPRVGARESVIDSAVKDLQEVLVALDLERCDLLGQSFGAVVAARATRRDGSRVRRLVLASPAAAPRGWLAPRMVFVSLATGGAIRVWPKSRSASLRRCIESLGGYALEPTLGGEDFDALVARVRRVLVFPFFRRLVACAWHSWMAELEGIDKPVLILEGEREVPLLPPAVLSFFRSRPNTSFVVVPGGHMPFLTSPDRFASAVSQFLDP